MSNGLEQEFPEVAWPAVPPIGPRGMSPEVARDYDAHDRELHGLTIRDSLLSGRGAIARALLAMIMIRRRRGRGPAGRPSQRDSRAGFARGA